MKVQAGMGHGMVGRLGCMAVVAGVALSAMGAQGRQGTNEVFTASPERREMLLAKVRAGDKERAAAKAKGPALTIVKDGEPAATIVAEPVPGRYAIQPAKV
ncbi:MAG: hypothetical protein HQ559_05800, partial [Lentisphaerae bacterium]|nr:hypothetical protein [Lentisphaerota bacterium]